jgi:alpha-aminoadipate carrier protein LysW
MKVECPVCGAELDLADDLEEGELTDCTDCGVELKVVSTNPVSLEKAQVIFE